MAKSKATEEASVGMEMKKLFTIKGKTFYWANTKFKYVGLWMWNGQRNVRVLAFNRFSEWSGDQ